MTKLDDTFARAREATAKLEPRGSFEDDVMRAVRLAQASGGSVASVLVAWRHLALGFAMVAILGVISLDIGSSAELDDAALDLEGAGLLP